jgi:hypothetical protein
MNDFKVSAEMLKDNEPYFMVIGNVFDNRIDSILNLICKLIELIALENDPNLLECLNNHLNTLRNANNKEGMEHE